MCHYWQKSTGEKKDNGNTTIVQDGYESSHALVASSNKFDKEWIMDYRFT